MLTPLPVVQAARMPVRLFSLACTLLILFSLLTTTRISTPSPLVPPPSTSTFDLNRLPLSFVPNLGQSDPAVQFQAQSMGGTLFFLRNEVVFSLPSEVLSPDTEATLDTLTTPELVEAVPASLLRLQWEGAHSSPELKATAPLPGEANYFLGESPDGWHTDVPTFAELTYQNIYPGIDLNYNGAGTHLKGTYFVEPGADPLEIRWRYAGAERVEVTGSTGDLHITLPEGTMLVEHAPIAWQERGEVREAVPVRYQVAEDNSVSFGLGAYDPTLPLTLDPELTYSTYLGGSGNDIVYGFAVDDFGNMYVTGSTTSSDFPFANALDPNGDSSYSDAFISKISAAGDTLLYSTYLGGGSYEVGRAVAVVQDGTVVITGGTRGGFPLANPIQAQGGGLSDAFVTKLNPTGDTLVFSTYLGGENDEFGRAVTVDNVGNSFVVGGTNSPDFPTFEALQETNDLSNDAFITSMDSDGTALRFSTFFGGNSTDVGTDIKLGVDGSLYVVGYTLSTDFPTVAPLQGTLIEGDCGLSYPARCEDLFVSRISPSGNAVLYSTYLGGSGADIEGTLDLDTAGNIYLTGATRSLDFPLVNSLQDTLGGDADVFVTKLNPAGSALLFSTYLGGLTNDFGAGVATDSAGGAYVTGTATSRNFPTAGAPLGTCLGNDLFVAQVDTIGANLVFSTCLGGEGDADSGMAIIADPVGTLYVAGVTGAPDFPVVNPFQENYGGGDIYDGFVLRLGTTQRVYLPLVLR